MSKLRRPPSYAEKRICKISCIWKQQIPIIASVARERYISEAFASDTLMFNHVTEKLIVKIVFS